MRALLLALLLLAPAAGLGAAGVVAGPLEERLVEGHTVFAVVEPARAATQDLGFAAAVAVLVREVERDVDARRFPGVLWFNDQYLVAPARSLEVEQTERHPCSGAVLAVNHGDADPRGQLNDTHYVESYRITDPHDRAWDVHRWNLSGRPVWTVAILGRDARSNESDDGACEGPVYGTGGVPCPGDLRLPMLGCVVHESVHVEGVTTHARQPGANDRGYPCGTPDEPCPGLQYNAVLYLLLRDLDRGGPDKDHNASRGTDWHDDVAGCQAYTDWPCPEQDDDREGNSHPYHPENLTFLHRYDGHRNHGGSDAAGTQDMHATRLVDVYYGTAPRPLAPRHVLTDVEGSTAPYHCHDEDLACGDP